MFKESTDAHWQTQCGFNPSTQNDITGWVKTNSLATATSFAAFLVTKNYMYILGGYGPDGHLNIIQRASFDTNGDLSSTWNNVGALPLHMSTMGYVATKGRFYLIGGYSNLGLLLTVYSAPINADGSLGDFRSETSLPAARANSVCFVIKDKLYVAGGNSNIVYRATVNNDGTLSNWKTLPNFPISFDFGKPLLIKDRIYIFGAKDTASHESKIYYTTYDSDGNIGSWAYVSNMPNNITASAIVCTDNYVFSIGGYNDNNGQYTDAVYHASILADGSIGAWGQIGNAPVVAAHVQVAITGNRIYFIDGCGRGVYLDNIYSATFTSSITDYAPYCVY